MSSVNKATILGRLGADPELKYTPTGQPVCELRVATSESYADKAGAKQERTEWHRVVFNGRLAEIVGQYLRKGSQVYVEGSLRTRKYTDKDGIEKFATEIRGETMQMLGGRQGMGGPSDDGGGYAPRQAPAARPAAAPAARPAPAAKPAPSSFDDMDDDIPF